MQKIMGTMRCAMAQYQMIAPGDHLAVGVSGGKDSLTMLTALAKMRDFYPVPYRLSAFSADPTFDGQTTDFSGVANLCDELGVPYHIIPTNLAEVLFEIRKEKNPCSLCAKMRRGILNKAVKEAGCNKLALAHHRDDAAETMMMNLLIGGRIGCFAPVTYLSERDLHVIRPLIFTTEKDIISAVRRNHLPVVASRCPVDGNTQRQTTKELIRALEQDYPALRQKIIGALQKGHIDRW